MAFDEEQRLPEVVRELRPHLIFKGIELVGMRRFTRLTNGFSKKIENHEAAVALHYMHYNFARIHQTLRITPAMAAGISNHVWSFQEIAALAESKVLAQAA
jgi:hypothetical protein